jgi:hypothetical protein
MIYFILLLVISIFVNEAIVELVSKSVFFRGFRDFLAAKKNIIFLFFGKVFFCPYCTSVWTSALFTTLIFILVSLRLTGVLVLDIFIFFIWVHRGSNLFHDIWDRYFTKIYR